MRPVVDGETVSGIGTVLNGAPTFPELLIFDGIGAGNGRLVCAVTTFHKADIAVKGVRTVELLICRHDLDQTPFSLRVENGIVVYDEGA